MNKIRKALGNAAIITILVFTTAAAAATDSATDNTQLSVERYALYVASNQGSETRDTLRYAGTDAESLARTMSDLGGVTGTNSQLLIDPNRKQIENAFASFSDTINKNKGKAKRTEFIFYYSGHSDEKALLLGDDSYDYSSLKRDLSIVPSDVHVVMLDSCFSGNFIRTKGGSRQKPFLVDDSTIVQGYAYLSSSSEYEPSQESDAIEGSYFTNAVITGLRGAADTSGDEKVSLNELYYYAFNDTLAKTETSSAGPQHPSYNITLVGSGDLILTDISSAESVLVIPAETGGQFYIRNSQGALVSQVNKAPGKEIALALSSGFYTVSLVAGGITSQSSVQLSRNSRAALNMTDFDEAVLVATTKRGDSKANTEATEHVDTVNTELNSSDDSDEYAYYDPMQDPFFSNLYAFINQKAQTVSTHIQKATESISIIETTQEPQIEEDSTENTNENIFDSYSPFAITVFDQIGFPMPMPKLVNVALGAFSIRNTDIFGLQAAGFMGVADGNLKGVQAAGFMNIAKGDLIAFQAAGFMNISSKYTFGVQGAGFMNIAKGDFKGFQAAGFMNITNGTTNGGQAAGFMNISKDDTKGIQAAGFMNIAKGITNGIQVAGFMNIADELNGVAIAPINISSGGTGLPIGIINFIKDGIFELSFHYDLEKNTFFQIKSGTKKMYTTLFSTIPTENNYRYGIGIGSRSGNDKAYIDFEIIAHAIAFQRENGEYNCNYDEFFPVARVTGYFSFLKHLGVYVSYSANINVTSWNNAAFKDSTLYSTSLWDDSVKIYHGVAFGIHL